MQVEDIKEYSTKIKRTEEEIAKGSSVRET